MCEKRIQIMATQMMVIYPLEQNLIVNGITHFSNRKKKKRLNIKSVEEQCADVFEG